ncbi:hypothetical protein SAMN05444159_4786 [Bradyrhizobium lablabi]|uniref:Secreted protein n=1 Tax=Bradyrhizobium lablabi TaxID=722472 RepID=A0A1M6X7I2_9BRAD|nr:hypothetical protein [Bradyrhizobium lablabi]SHL01873.1 hypothetical protein SAMN05444159_4786 [Bradyrhizobium lablabi]
MKTIMKRLVMLVGATIGLCAASAVTAEPRDSVERGTRMDTDAIRDDVRTNRLQIPEHPLAAEQSPQPAPSSKGKSKSRRSGGSSH